MSYTPSFKIGETVSNRQISTEFNVSNVGRMRKSSIHNCLVIITDPQDDFYKDKWNGDELLFVGIGKNGDQTLEGNNNRTLFDSATNNQEVHLFELSGNKNYKYCGVVKLSKKPYQELQKDPNGKLRQVWIFPLVPVEDRQRSTSLEANSNHNENQFATDKATIQKKPNRKKRTAIIGIITSIVLLLVCVIAADNLKRKEEERELTKQNEINNTILEWVKPVANQYGITDISINSKKIDYEQFILDGECKRYYFTSKEFERLSNDKKLDVLEALYELLCPIGKDLYYCAGFDAQINSDGNYYSLFVDKGYISLVEGNIVSSSITRSSDYAISQAQSLGLEVISSNSSTSASSSSSKEKVKCSMCNGTGSVKYYYGESTLEAILSGHNDYEWGKCTSCNGTGYVYVNSSGSSSGGTVTCPSCGKRVSSLQTRKDNAGVNRTWCSSCWSEYDEIMGN